MVAQQPEGLKTMAKVFPNWEADSRWSQALEKVENSSRPYLKEVQRYEKYRCSKFMGMGWSRQPSLLATGVQFQPPSTPSCTKPPSASPQPRSPVCPHPDCVPLKSEPEDPMGEGKPQEVSIPMVLRPQSWG